MTVNYDVVFIPLLTRFLPLLDTLDGDAFKEVVVAISEWFMTGEEKFISDPVGENLYRAILIDLDKYRKDTMKTIAQRKNGAKGGAPIGNSNARKVYLNSAHSNRLNDDKAQIRTIADNCGIGFSGVRTNLRVFLRDLEQAGIQIDDYYTFCWRLEQYCNGGIRIENGRILQNN